MERQNFIDQLKAVSIFLIVLGHNDNTSLFSEYLTTFRLPLFFIISGYLSKDKQNVKIQFYLEKMFRRLLVPYFLISLFLYLFWLIANQILSFGDWDYDPIKNFVGIFYAQGGSDYMAWGIQMWYLPALFSVSMIDYFVSKLSFKFRFFPALLLPVFGIMLFKFLGFHLPWSLDNAMDIYLFYFFGVLIRRIDLIQLIKGKEVWVFIVFFSFHFIGASFNMPINYYYASFGNTPLMFLNGMTGFLWMFATFRLLPSHRAITWIGKNTLPILAFHFLAMSFIQAIAFYGFGIILVFSPFMSLLYSVMQVLLLVPVILFINRYLPFLVGLSKPRLTPVLIMEKYRPSNYN
jgi:fucose 4-O-acetylase-like acetyltransferase